MLPPGRDMYIPEIEKQNAKPSGVLLLLYPDGEELYICLIKRSANMKIHAGQISFPGGKQDCSDANPRETALRETTEEIGLPAEQISILGRLTPLYVSVSRYIIYPFVGWIHEKPRFPVNHHEVEKLLFFPLLRHIQNPVIESKELNAFSGKFHVPGIPFQEEFIWGATAMILSEFLDVISAAQPTRG